MKIHYLLMIVLIVSFSGCGKTAAKMEHTSPNGKVKLTLTGNRMTGLEAWQVEMKVKAYNFKEDQLAFEVYADDLNDQTVLFNWTDEEHCSITFKQRDGADKKFSLTASPQQLEVTGM